MVIQKIYRKNSEEKCVFLSLRTIFSLIYRFMIIVTFLTLNICTYIPTLNSNTCIFNPPN